MRLRSWPTFPVQVGQPHESGRAMRRAAGGDWPPVPAYVSFVSIFTRPLGADSTELAELKLAEWGSVPGQLDLFNETPSMPGAQPTQDHRSITDAGRRGRAA